MVAVRRLAAGVVTRGFFLTVGEQRFIAFGPFPDGFLIDRVDLSYSPDTAAAQLEITLGVHSDVPASVAEFDAGRRLTLGETNNLVPLVLISNDVQAAHKIPVYQEMSADLPFLTCFVEGRAGTSTGWVGLELRSQAHRRAVELALEDVRELLGER